MSPVTIFPTTSVWGTGDPRRHSLGSARRVGCDLDRLVALCPPCHAQTDAPYVRGRLMVTPLSGGRFTHFRHHPRR